ncbi:MAG TPA: SEC-C metal-binding domain-containing protein, partial [Gemmataceae bacterium]|nr:SEC-C metal-binding domain-containing protein [Gemmataceae bacterium]
PEHVGREAEIVAQAGRISAVTISTNMAGRGTDIILGGNPETLAWARLKQLKDADNRPLYPTRLEVPNDVWHATVQEIETKEKMKEEGRKVADMGGLHIVGTERHEARRIDNQLRGRAGRQGDPGSSKFFLSLEDDLMRMFAGEMVQKALTWMGMQEGEAIESGMVSRRIEKAQKKVEEYHFEQRKNLLEYDEVMDFQRKKVYGARQEVLDGKNPRAMIMDMIEGQIGGAVAKFTADDYGAASYAEFASNRLGVDFDGSEFRGTGPEDAAKVALEKAVTAVPTVIQEMIEENLNPDEDPKDWKWIEMVRALNARFGIKLTDKEMKKIGPDALMEHLVREGSNSVRGVDLSDGARFLARTYPIESLADWVRQKFTVKVPVEELDSKGDAELAEFLAKKVRQAYRQKDNDFPVQVGMQNYMSDKGTGGAPKFDRDGLYRWAANRFGAVLAAKAHGPDILNDQAGFYNAAFKGLADGGFTEEVLRTEPRSKIREVILSISRSVLPAADADELDAKLDDVFSGTRIADTEDAQELVDWAKAQMGLPLDVEKLAGKTRDEARHSVLNAFDATYRPEMHSVERGLVLEQLDSAWKTHLLSMDNLRSSVGLRGYAQEDPKIVYKREGMKEFDAMWEGIHDRVTEAVFRMEEMGDEEAQAALWAGARATHQAASSAAQSRAAQEEAQNQTTNSGEAKKTEPIRNIGATVGRNDPCPCGSGQKYKNCHMKMEAGKK